SARVGAGSSQASSMALAPAGASASAAGGSGSPHASSMTARVFGVDEAGEGAAASVGGGSGSPQASSIAEVPCAATAGANRSSESSREIGSERDMDIRGRILGRPRQRMHLGKRPAPADPLRLLGRRNRVSGEGTGGRHSAPGRPSGQKQVAGAQWSG